MTTTEVHIEQIKPELTWKLRHHVLYPHTGNIYTQGIPTDNEGVHFGAFYGNNLAGVVSLFQKGTDFQFRKLAVDVALQQKGIGRQLLQYITNYAVTEGATRLWCNARVTAAGFYEKAGFSVTGQQFSRNGFDYVIMEKKPLPGVIAPESTEIISLPWEGRV